MSVPGLRAAVVTLVLTLAFACPATAGAPTDALRSYVDRTFALLDDPGMKGAQHAPARQHALRALAAEAVDFHEAAERALGAYWDGRTPEERVRFVRLFTELINHAYFSRLSHDGERIVYDDETTSGHVAQVRARALAKNGGVTPVIFSLRRDTDARWRIFDVSFEGMSLVGSYRAQFNKVIRTTSYDEMIRQLEAKTRAGAQAATAEPSSETNAP